MSETLFTKIIKREIPADIIHEDAECVAIRDINPQAPFHALVIPKKPLSGIDGANADDAALLGHLLIVCRDLARSEGLQDGYRLVINNGKNAGQDVAHLHIHMLGKRGFSWPPG